MKSLEQIRKEFRESPEGKKWHRENNLLWAKSLFTGFVILVIYLSVAGFGIFF